MQHRIRKAGVTRWECSCGAEFSNVGMADSHVNAVPDEDMTDEEKAWGQEFGPKFPDVEVELTGQDGNVFNVIGLVRKGLQRAGHNQAASQFAAEAMVQESYDKVLQLCMKWVVVS